MTTTLENRGIQLGSGTVGPLSQTESEQIVDEILDSLKNPGFDHFNPALSAELQIWIEMKNRQTDPVANAIVDMVRAGNKPLHRFYTPTVQSFLSKVESTSRGYHDGGGSVPPRESTQQQQTSRFR